MNVLKLLQGVALAIMAVSCVGMLASKSARADAPGIGNPSGMIEVTRQVIEYNDRVRVSSGPAAPTAVQAKQSIVLDGKTYRNENDKLCLVRRADQRRFTVDCGSLGAQMGEWSTGKSTVSFGSKRGAKLGERELLLSYN